MPGWTRSEAVMGQYGSEDNIFFIGSHNNFLVPPDETAPGALAATKHTVLIAELNRWLEDQAEFVASKQQEWGIVEN